MQLPRSSLKVGLYEKLMFDSWKERNSEGGREEREREMKGREARMKSWRSMSLSPASYLRLGLNRSHLWSTVDLLFALVSFVKARHSWMGQGCCGRGRFPCRAWLLSFLHFLGSGCWYEKRKSIILCPGTGGLTISSLVSPKGPRLVSSGHWPCARVTLSITC